MNTLTINDKEFKLSIPSTELERVVSGLANQINTDLKGKELVFLAILNGSFMFASDLLKRIELPCQISFLKLASYSGTTSSGQVKQLIGLNENLSRKTVVILEDIVDTGITLENIVKQIKGFGADEIKIASLLFKPEAYKGNLQIDYLGMRIPNRFIVGYGLDYDGYGRNLDGIYEVIDNT